MTPRLPIAIAIMGLVSAGFVSTTLTARAQQTPPKTEDAAADHPKHHHFVLNPEDRAAFLDARLAALHAGLALTPDQDKLWPPVEAAMRDFAKFRAAARQKFQDEKRPVDPVARLQLRGDTMIASGQALKKIADAEAPLYATLTDAQKHRLPMLMHGFRNHFAGNRHHFAMMGREHRHDGPGTDGPERQ
jgi:hypothetical protein